MNAASARLRPLDFLIAALTAALLAGPFLDKAFHIDDPVVLQVTANILADPGDPLAGEMDWFGHNLPLWEVTTNPPLLSYWLAPPAALFGYSERALHLAMTPFLFLMAISLAFLSARFTGRRWMPALFALLTPAVWVSVNVMRDVPAAALVCAGLTLGVAGVDGRRRAWIVAGALLCGLASVTKYSAALSLPLLALYPLLRRAPRLALWSIPGLLPLACWCLFTQVRYGWIHPIYLLSGSHPGGAMAMPDRFMGMLAVAGASLFLAPPLLAHALQRDRRAFFEAAAAAAVLGLAAGWCGWSRAGLQGVPWSAAGAVVIWLCLREGFSGWREEEASQRVDSQFLLAWAGGFLAFSVLLVPFQAVRHLIAALPPLAFLAFRRLDRPKPTEPQLRGRTDHSAAAWGLAAWLGLQAAAGALVNIADAQYASVYREAAQEATRKWSSERGTLWYVGHWGWSFYAQQAGLRQLHREGPLPETGDTLIWPRRVHVGDALAGWPGYRERLQPLESNNVNSWLPVRTMNFRCAAFYAVIRCNVPYCFQSDPLEEIRVYRVEPPP